MKKVMFLCHGNICRSPIAEYVFKNISKQYDVYCESKAVSSEEIGNPMYPSAVEVLKKNGIPFGAHIARQFTANDYEAFDYIVIMESYNMPRLLNIIGSDSQNKVKRLLDFTNTSGDIEDPWYSGNFDKVFSQIEYGCKCLLEHIIKSTQA